GSVRLPENSKRRSARSTFQLCSPITSARCSWWSRDRIAASSRTLGRLRGGGASLSYYLYNVQMTVADRLRAAGLRATRPRIEVAETLRQLGGHRTADEVHAR